MRSSAKVAVVVISIVIFVAIYLSVTHRSPSPANSRGLHTENHNAHEHHMEEYSESSLLEESASALDSIMSYDDSGEHAVHEEHGTKGHSHPKPEGDTWTGIPITKGNPLFQPVMLEIPEEACLPISEHTGSPHFEEELLKHYQEWIPKIGFNNIIDCIDRNDLELTIPEDHSLGSVLTEYTKDLNLPPKYIIEVVSRDIIHYAPLHGATWRLIATNEISKDLSTKTLRKKFFQFVDEQLCPFRNKDLGALWVACIHGVGHGLGDIMDLSDAMNICVENENLDFGYTCASGVFMTTQDPTTTTWEPCDTMPFPALCFRFKKPLWSLFRQYRTVYPCFVDPPFPERILRACVWGHAFSQPDPHHEISDLVDFCAHYENQSDAIYLSCVDGFLHNIHLIHESEVKYCNELAKESAQDLCHYYASLGLYFNPTHNPWYNLPLLEGV